MYSDDEWDFNWCDVGWLRENFDHTYMEEHVRICHFRNHYELTRKNLMVKNLKRYRKTLDRKSGCQEADKCDFFPRTFDLPSEYHLFVEEFKKSPGSIWIMKPNGIRFEEQKDEAQIESHVAQRYIEKPYLINDVHLTNVAVQKTAPDYDPEKGCKWQLQQLRRYLTTKHGRKAVENLFKDIDNIFIRSLQSVQKVIINDKHCFELYGYDILLDQDLKPLTGREKQVGGFDLMWNDGPVYREDMGVEALGSAYQKANTHLGCVNDRKKQLQQLLKPLPGQKRI
ncbi:putative tubulin polyglutamylase TTLL9 [Bagarius yarrelli]|uniref:Tubulin--tyrosine ligase-like protein 9 n=1 Tax=Bagarius yarrelli TaxID=175774 RepID=A0A556UYV6_BAGYA|nr:putative tubulin polyglutamylase TTLL9 [Bagarius yarrelli]